MPRSAKGRKSSKVELEKLYRYCRYCKANRSCLRFDKHEKACKTLWVIRQEDRTLHARLPPIRSTVTETAPCSAEDPENGCQVVEGCGSMGPTDVDPDENSDSDSLPHAGPLLPSEYIKIIPHPHSPDPTAKIIPLASPMSASGTNFQPQLEARPWAPFASLADFEYTETAVLGLLSKDLVNKQLKGLNSTWADGSRLSIKNYKDMEKALTNARKYFVQFKSDVVSATYEGKLYQFPFEYRDPWEWILTIIQDKTLSSLCTWHSVKKYYCSGGKEERIYDEPHTADTWAAVDDALPATESASDFSHCYIPLHFWLDKGLVTRRVLKYPMVLRPAWLPRQIRNGSGNGGGVLVGYMPIINDPYDPSSRSAPEKEEFARFKREVYQKILRRVFKTLKQRSHHGEAHLCADGRGRILYPGILIESQDAEEAAYFCACRAASANYPCPKCLVKQSELHNILDDATIRTPETMRAVIERASRAKTKTAKEDILKGHGLHDIEHFLWEFRFSDPYKALSYDTLHSDDLGKWGKHLWVLLLSVLENTGAKGKLTRRMAIFPRWSGLKHFNNVSTTNFTDGQAFYDILKCILPCIVDLLPKNSVLVHCIRAYIRYRLLIGLRCMTETRLEYIQDALAVYYRCCEDVTKIYGKSFDFLKQHASHHVILDVCEKGTTDNYSTRVGEGFQQESAQAYDQTNMKDAEHQMVVIDEKLEAMAWIRMAIDNDTKARAALSESDNLMNTPGDASCINDEISELESGSETLAGNHWKFGSPEGRKTNLRNLVAEREKDHPEYHSLDERLRNFIAHNLPSEALLYEENIFVQRYRCVSLTYQSQEDWTEGQNIMRCNSSFHGRPRFDCVIIHDDAMPLSVARIRDLIRCWLPSGKVLDLAIIHGFSRSKWRPKTVWDGCRVLDESPSSSLVCMDYVLRGALLCPVSERTNEKSYYFIDTMDSDIFLRENYPV